VTDCTLDRIAIGFNPNISGTEAAEYASLAESRGFESFWVHENPFIKDAISLMSSAIFATKNIKIGSGCVSVVTRHPLLVASSFAALDEMSGGRVQIGVGLGGFPWLPKIGVKVFPVQETKPLKRITEFLTITDKLLGGESVSLDGEFFKVTDIKLDSAPKHRPPLYLAAFGEQLLRMAPKLAQGVIISPALMTPEVTGRKVRFVREEESSTKRTDIASYVLTTVSKDSQKARQTMKSYYFLIYQVAEVIKPEIFEPYGLKAEGLEPIKDAWRRKDLAAAARAMPDEVIEALTLTGDPDQCAERLKDYRKAGVDLPILMPIGDINAAMNAFTK
jgi:5,10-methylenetetrahydromethanopterin reductase